MGTNIEAIVAELKSIDRKETNNPSPMRSLMGIRDDQPVGWSDTHSWPWVYGKLQDLGLIRQVSRQVMNEKGFTALRYRNVTEFTDLGRMVRGALMEAQ